MKTTFWQLIDKGDIEIPMIQRDFAQGRKDGPAPYIRGNILSALATTLKTGTPLDFDFIYGRYESSEFWDATSSFLSMASSALQPSFCFIGI